MIQLEKWNADFLQKMSLQTDAAVEQLIADVALSKEFSNLRELFHSITLNTDTASSKNLPQAILTYFNSNNELPNWADLNKIKLAQDVFAQYGPEIALILNYKALPLCYSCKNGAKVLATTGRLGSRNGNTSVMMRRLLETSQMVINVMSEGGFSPSGAGILSVKKVRLYHAAIRYFLLHPEYNPGGWNTDYYGLPINQEELAGTLTAFSALVINGLTQVGVELSMEQKDAYMHCWNIVGHYIGLDPSLYPVSYQDGWELGIAIIKRNQLESEDGKYLVSSLILNAQTYFFKGLLLKHLPEYLISYFIEDVAKAIQCDLAQTIGIASKENLLSRLDGALFIDSMEVANKVEGHLPVVKSFLAKHCTEHLKELVQLYLNVNAVEFYIPDSLRANWNMN